MRTILRPWIYSAFVDSLFVLAPPFIILVLLFLLPVDFVNNAELSPALWVLLILFVDVSHVYSTLYRTYFDGEAFEEHKALLLNVPIVAFVLSVVVYSIGALWFWRVLAYLAVFHFVRQQYGFLRLYAHKQPTSKLREVIDEVAIYTVTLYPIIYWHLTGPGNFNWFVQGDFRYFESALLLRLALTLYVFMIISYALSEGIWFNRTGVVNLPKNAVMLGTALSWYFGIIYFKGDLSFTALNVVSHGVPYMALVWIYGKKKSVKHPQHTNGFLRVVFSRYGVVLFVLVLLLFAYVEEGMWDGLVWHDHPTVFGGFYFLPKITSDNLLAVVVPLLTLPQLTHYILDGFIWKLKGSTQNWKNITLEENA